MTEPLDKLVREARATLGTDEARDVDWSAVDRALFARIESVEREERRRFVGVRRWPTLAAGVAATVAAAAAFAFAIHDGQEHGRESLARVGGESGGRIVEIEGGGQVLIDGQPASRGTSLRLGDVIEVRGGPVTIERPGKLTMRVEAGSRAAVTHTEGALVLALATGAVEAQVVPVPNGEAFAVDIGGARVAVHGTHLRVARSGDRVAVDLNEGVVAVGNAPRVGSVIGSLVTAPAHAEFAAADIAGTLAVSHEVAEVRPAVALVALAPGRREAEAQPAEAPAASPAAAPMAAAAAPAPHGAAAMVLRPEHTAPSTAPAASPVGAAEANPEQAVSNAVRACMAERPHAENVTVVVSTTLHLELSDDGSVHAARFEPPVAPDVNACAAAAIYKARFAHGGSASIVVDFSN